MFTQNNNCYRVINDHMAPLIKATDFIFLKPVGNFIINGNVYAIKIDCDDELLIRILTDTGDSFILNSPNPRYTEYRVSKSDVVEIYEVCALFRTSI